MLKKYTLSGFGPFLLDETIDLTKSKSKEINHQNIKNGILPIIALYGPNGGGKTSVLKSLELLTKFVLDSKPWTFYNLVEKTNKLDDNHENLSFEIEFEIQNKIYQYSIQFNNEDVVNESLYFMYTNTYRNEHKDMNLSRKKVKLFVRTNDEISFTSNLINKSLNSFINTNLNLFSKKSVLTFLNEFNLLIDDYQLVYSEFQKIKFLDLDTFNRSQFDDFKNEDEIQKLYQILKTNKKTVLKILNDVDINIQDFEFIYDPISKQERIIKINVLKLDNYDQNYKLRLGEESSGTLRFIYLLTFFLEAFENNWICLADEINSGLHTKLLEYVIRLFSQSKISNESQLIFTSHDLGILKKELLRRDEIYFVALNTSRFSNIVSLNDLSVKNDWNYSKLYYDGKLGYDPYIEYCKTIFNNEI